MPCSTPSGFFCSKCGQFHEELVMNFGADAPGVYYSVPPNERDQRCDLTSDICVIDQDAFYVRGLIEIPVLDGTLPFAWGVWVGINFQNFRRMFELWESPERVNEPPFPGWLATALPLYPETLDLNVFVYNRPVGQCPTIKIAADHPLAIEQRIGITLDRVRAISEEILHKAL